MGYTTTTAHICYRANKGGVNKQILNNHEVAV